ncbi:MAG: GAF domain-containing protein [Flavobacterium sp.]|nr:GAF domain-containing protein [Flavobacterium sp.]
MTLKIKDIVNRDIVTLTNCEYEPIHIPGSIQPHGFLLGADDTHTIKYCSGNIDQYLGKTYPELIGSRLDSIFDSKTIGEIKAALRKPSPFFVLPIDLIINQDHYQIKVHKSEDITIIEAEPRLGNVEGIASVYDQTSQFVLYMNQTDTLRELCDMVAKGTRKITGYDRVMIYRFDQDYNGEVYAESCRDDLESFLGLHYPHTDIPVQARQLYLKNLSRLIVDIGYTPVPIYTADDGTDKKLDLSLSVLRSTSPIHVEYLSNMGVGATLTISLVHRDRLWGLIACHHYSPKNLSPELRLAAQLQGQFITSQIDVRQSNQEYEVSRQTNIALEKLNAVNLPPIIESMKILSISPQLLKVCNAAGVSIIVGGEIFKNGHTPSDDCIEKLSDFLEEYTNETHFTTDRISEVMPDWPTAFSIAGVIFHSLGNGNSVIWYRPETEKVVHWGGNPQKAIVKDENGLHPRNSFHLWKEIVRGRSNPWAQPEVNAAANYSHYLQKQIGFMLLSREEERYRRQSIELTEINRELENINWISGHDLQEPLRKIQMMASKIKSQNEDLLPETVSHTLGRIQHSAQTMQNLLIDILRYTQIKHTERSMSLVDLNTVVAEVLQEWHDTLSEQNADLTVDYLPKVNAVPLLTRQLFSNLLSNAIKFQNRERQLKIKIGFDGPKIYEPYTHETCYRISVTDNGLGFEPQHASQIFNIFKKVHYGEFAGSGIGLALCKKIMQAFKGNISAEGSLENGSTIYLYFPVNFK